MVGCIDLYDIISPCELDTQLSFLPSFMLDSRRRQIRFRIRSKDVNEAKIWVDTINEILFRIKSRSIKSARTAIDHSTLQDNE